MGHYFLSFSWHYLDLSQCIDYMLNILDDRLERYTHWKPVDIWWAYSIVQYFWDILIGHDYSVIECKQMKSTIIQLVILQIYPIAILQAQQYINTTESWYKYIAIGQKKGWTTLILAIWSFHAYSSVSKWKTIVLSRHLTYIHCVPL